VTPEEDILVGDDRKRWPDTACACWQIESLRRRLSGNARRLVEERYGWETIAKNFCGWLSKLHPT